MNEEETGRLRAWIERILVTGDALGPYSIERLCRKAGTSPTNISRFMRDDSHVPGLAVLARIANAAGVPPPGVTMSTDPMALVDVPLISAVLFRTNGRQGAIVASTAAVRAPIRYAKCVALQITTDTGSQAGILRGDVVIADTDVVPAFNDLVVVALDTGDAGIYRVHGPYLMPQATGNYPALNIETSFVIGVARQVQREL